MKFIILQPHARHTDPLPEWFGPEIAREVILIVPADRRHQYEGWAGKLVALARYMPGGELDCVALRLAREHAVERIAVLGEDDIVRAAELRRMLGLPGQSVESATAFRNKAVMKRIVSEAGIPVADHVSATSPLDVIEFVERVGFPVVAKPFGASGSAGTLILRDRATLEAILSHETEIRGLIETFVPGDMYHVDGFVHRGEVVLVCPSRYVNGMLAFQTKDVCLSVQLDADNPLRARLEDMARAVLAAMPLPEATPFHLEVFHTPDDRLVFNEIASRTGGIRIGDAVARTYGLELTRASIEFQLGLRTSLPAPPKADRVCGTAVVPPMPGRLEALPRSLDVPGIVDFHTNHREGDIVKPAESSACTMAYLLGEAPTEAELVRRLMAGVDAFQRTCRVAAVE